MDRTGTSLLDTFMPSYDVRTRHATTVRAPATTTYEALRRTDLFDPWIVRALFALRVLPSRIGRPASSRPRVRTLDDLARGGALLGTDPGRELTFGLIGRFWALRQRSHRPIDPATFADFSEPGLAKAVITFIVRPIDARTTMIGSETRVLCTDPASRRRFRLYWVVIGPFSGWTRVAWLKAVRADAERQVSSV
jgi:hypothetical protein